MRKPDFCICENKTQISFAVTVKLISTFVLATRIEQSLFFGNFGTLAFFTGFTAWFVSNLVDREDRFSHDTAHIILNFKTLTSLRFVSYQVSHAKDKANMSLVLRKRNF